MPSSTDPFTLSERLSAAEEDAITQALGAFNLAVAGSAWSAPEEARPVQVSARDASGVVVGGLIGQTHAIPYWLNVSVLWVEEAARGRGIGTELLRRAEQIAHQRGCRYARLATSHYQAPAFYRWRGYHEYGRLDDCPPGETVYYFRKSLP